MELKEMTADELLKMEDSEDMKKANPEMTEELGTDGKEAGK